MLLLGLDCLVICPALLCRSPAGQPHLWPWFWAWWGIAVWGQDELVFEVPGSGFGSDLGLALKSACMHSAASSRLPCSQSQRLSCLPECFTDRAEGETAPGDAQLRLQTRGLKMCSSGHWNQRGRIDSSCMGSQNQIVLKSL